MKLQQYIEMNTKFARMNNLVDLWAIDYQFEKLLPLVNDGYDYDDIVEFLQVRFGNFVHGGRLDELLEQQKQKGEK